MDRLPNSFIGAASAEVAVHGLRDLVVGRIRCLRQQRGRRHNLAGLAVSALRDLFGNPRLLQHVQAVGTEAFDRSYALACGLRYRSRARTDRISIKVNGASPTQSSAASKFCTGEFQRVAQNPEQRCLRRDAYLFFTTVNAKVEVGHWGPVDWDWKQQNMVSGAGARGQGVSRQD